LIVPSSPEFPPTSFGQCFLAAVHFWERGRLAYNLVLAAAFALWVISTWPHFHGAFTFSNVLSLIVLALLANVCYAFAYLIDVPVQFSSFRAAWLRYRWALWVLGMLLALVLENYWIADEIYPFLR
jgi:hypothetical protein